MSVTAKVTDASFETDVIKSDDAGRRRLLGGMVRAVPHDRAGA